MEKLEELIQQKKKHEFEIENIKKEIHYHLGDVIINFFKDKGFIFSDVEQDNYCRKNGIADSRYSLYLTNKKNLPDIFDWFPFIDIQDYYNFVNFSYKLKSNITDTLDGCSWYWEKETLEHFYERKLKKLFENN